MTLGLADEAASPKRCWSARASTPQAGDDSAVTFALTKRTFNTPLLERVDAASELNVAAQQAWSSPEVQARMRAYLDETLRRGK